MFIEMVFSYRGSWSTLFFRFLFFIRFSSAVVFVTWSEKNLRLSVVGFGFAFFVEVMYIFYVDFFCIFTLENDRLFCAFIMYLASLCSWESR